MDVFVRDRDADADGIFDERGGDRTGLVSASTAGIQGNRESGGATIFGGFIAFSSDATNLVDGDTNESETSSSEDCEPGEPSAPDPRTGAVTKRVTVIALLAAASAACFSPAASAGLQTLVTTRHPITQFGQDGNRIAWSAQTGRYEARVWVRALVRGRSMRLASCGNQSQARVNALVLAGARAFWDCSSVSDMFNLHSFLQTRALGERFVHNLECLGDYCDQGWLSRGPTAGDGRTLVYSVLDSDCTSREPDRECAAWARSGAVKRVSGGRVSILPGVPHPARLAASSGRIALASAAPATGTDYPTAAAENGSVEVRDAATGTLSTTFTPVGVVRALALTPTTVAVLVEDASGAKRIERYAVSTGALLGLTAVPRTTVEELSMAGRHIVFRTGRSIRLLDVRSGRTRRLAVAGSRPIGLSIEGDRIAWAVNGRNGRGRVRALCVPLGSTHCAAYRLRAADNPPRNAHRATD